MSALKKISVATVIKVMGRFYRISYNNEEYDAVLRGRMRKRPEFKRFSSPVAVGDSVEIDLSADGECSIEKVLPRRNAFSRRDRESTKEDVIAANLDSVLVIQSFGTPEINLRFVDRIFVRSCKEKIPVILCVNKLDLSTSGDMDYIKAYYEKSGLELFFVSARDGSNLDKLLHRIKGHRTLLCGNSGVGKTSILNCLFPGINLRTTEVSDSTGKGRHTTTNVQLISIENGTELIDTPGMRGFGLMGIEPHMLSGFIPEFDDLAEQCRFSPCTHDHEPGCAVKKAVEAGDVHPDRYESYLQILYSLKDYYDNMY